MARTSTTLSTSSVVFVSSKSTFSSPSRNLAVNGFSILWLMVITFLSRGKRRRQLINLRRSIVLSILGLLIPRPALSARRQDRAAVAPDMKVLLENERVRVQFHDVKVGEKTPMHS